MTAFPASLAGVRVLIVGGSGAVGGALAKMAAVAGAQVIATSRQPAPLTRAPEPGEILPARLDLADPAAIAACLEAVAQVWSGIDLLVLTAGTTRSVELSDLGGLDPDLVNAVFASNAAGPLLAVRAAAPLLLRGEHAAIINISSVAARTGVGSNIAYVGAKAAMDAMTVSLAKALAPAVRVIGIAPSALDTPFAKGRGPEFIARTIAATPLGRLASVEEVALAALVAARFLPMTTGVVIPVDGGRHL